MTGLPSVLQLEMQIKGNICYLVPAVWWKQLLSKNKSIATKQQIIYPSLSLERFVDNFLLEFQEVIIAQLEHKSNYLKFNKIVICPQIKKEVEWTAISSDIWRMVSKKLKPKFGIMTIYSQQNPNRFTNQNQIQVQIIFCSKSKSDVFVGFLPEKSNTAEAIRNIGFELGFVQMNNSRILFPDKNPDSPNYFYELENTTIAEGLDTFFLAYNLQCIQQKQLKNEALDFSFGKGEQLCNSNEAMAGDVGFLGVQSFQQIRNDGTLSTGAQTPSFFGSEDQNMRQFRVRQLFRQKKPQQIEELRKKAKKIIRGDLIIISQKAQQQLMGQLKYVGQQIQESIQVQKKKCYKQK